MKFADTNVLLYAISRDQAEREKAARANAILDGGDVGLSVQVLQEFYVNVTSKIPSPLSPSKARGIISQYFVWHVELNTPASLLHASEIQERYRLSFWDALIVTAASRAGSAILYSEDFSHGQIVEGVRVVNPFRNKNSRRPRS